MIVIVGRIAVTVMFLGLVLTGSAWVLSINLGISHDKLHVVVEGLAVATGVLNLALLLMRRKRSAVLR